MGSHVAAIGVEDEVHFAGPIEAVGDEDGADAGEDGAEEIAQVAAATEFLVLVVGIVTGDGSGDQDRDQYEALDQGVIDPGMHPIHDHCRCCSGSVDGFSAIR